MLLRDNGREPHVTLTKEKSMKTIISLILAVAFSASVVRAAQPLTTNSLENVMEKLRNKPHNTLLQVSADESTISYDLAQKALQTDNVELKKAVLQHCLDIELQYPKHPKYKSRSDNYVLLEQIIPMFEKNGGAPDCIANYLFDLYHPTDLDRYADRIRTKVYSTPSRDMDLGMLSVYAVLPSNKPKEVQTFIKKFADDPHYYKYEGEVSPVLLGILARYGDTNSENLLIKWTEDLGVRGPRDANSIRDFIRAFMIADTPKIKKMLAKEVRSNVLIPSHSFTSESKRNMCAEALSRIYRDDPAFPTPPKYSYTNQDLNSIERWCEKNLKVKYPAPTPSPTSAAAAK
jgi:hypothetical protein